MDRRSFYLDAMEEFDQVEDLEERMVGDSIVDADVPERMDGARTELGTPVVLVHGFGASGYHWRYCAPSLSRNHRVYAPCLIGFGLSEKPQDAVYVDGELWRDQLVHFLENVVQEPAVLVGNSLGGRAVLHVAATRPDLVRGLVLVNSAGRFEDNAGEESLELDADDQAQLHQVSEWLREKIQRIVLSLTFLCLKRPQRIKQVLQLVYANHDRIDQSLVDSIVEPALDTNAMDTFVKVVSQTRTQTSMNELLEKLQVPTLLLWGTRDPWIRPDKAEAIRKLYPNAEYYPLDSGHCPQDDSPEEFVEALVGWIEKLPK